MDKKNKLRELKGLYTLSLSIFPLAKTEYAKLLKFLNKC